MATPTTIPRQNRPLPAKTPTSPGAAAVLGVTGTVSSAALPALLAATDPDSCGGQFFGLKGLGDVGGAPAQRELWAPLRSDDDARRLWEVSERLIGVRFPA